MTRFARAIGSKSSNKKIPVDATPWNQLKSAAKNYHSPKKIAWKRPEARTSDDKSRKSQESQCTKPENFKRRKPLTDIPSLFKDGQEINIVRFEGFPVRTVDAVRLKELKMKMLASKIPHAELKKTMKLERRKAEKALAREKKKLCFHCRNSGHILSECPELDKNDDRLPESGICFKCGSTEHQHTHCRSVRGDVYKYATCFICKESGHISKQCPDNPRGLYPDGGSCKICGDVTHLKKDCVKYVKCKKDEFEITVNTMNTKALDALDEDLCDEEVKPRHSKKKIIKM